MKIAGKTDIGKNRAENQDNFRSGEVNGVGAWGVVCDGMGGAQHGRLASTVAVDCMEEVLYRHLRAGAEGFDAESVLREAIGAANREVYKRSGEGREVMGTTVVAAVALGETLYLAHVGDSRAYMLEDGRLRRLTRDHSMVQELLDMGSITTEEAQRHPERNVITRALGVEDEVEITFTDLPMPKEGVLLLCTDGLSGMLRDDVIEELMKDSDFFDMPRRLVNAALTAGGDDNITVLLMCR